MMRSLRREAAHPMSNPLSPIRVGARRRRDLLLEAALIALAAAILTTASGCGSGPPLALLRHVSPYAGSSAVDLQIHPSLELALTASWEIDPKAPQLLLYDVTAGARARVGGTLEIEGQRATYIPSADLARDHDFAWVLTRHGITGLCAGTACNNDDLAERDASEWPEEPLHWPIEIPFTTRSNPTVRAVYLTASNQLVVRFSQAMDPVTTSPQFTLKDDLGHAIPLGPAVWIDAESRSARFLITSPLAPTGLYTLIVKRQALGADGSPFDGDGDGRGGETGDDFSVRFTGSQGTVILSRYAAGRS